MLDDKIVEAENAPSRAQRLLMPNDIIFQTVRPYQQNNYFYATERDLPTIASTGYAVIRTKQDPKFVYSLIHTQRFLTPVMQRCTGSSYPAVTGTDLEDIPTWMPCLEEQKRIGALLDLIGKKIDAQTKIIETLKKYKRGLLDRVFNQNNGLYPSSWTEISIEDLFEPISDKNHPDETVLTIIQGQGTAPRDSIERRIAYDKSSVKTYKLTDVGDFILHLRSFEGGLEKTNQKGIVSPAYTVLRPKLIVETGFYYAYFRSYWFINNKLRDSVEGIRDGKSINMTSFSHIRRHPDIPGTRRCMTCGVFVAQPTGRREKKFCSDKCRMAWWNSHPEAINKKAYYILVCEECGKEFESYGNNRRKYCCRNCYLNARRAKSV